MQHQTNVPEQYQPANFDESLMSIPDTHELAVAGKMEGALVDIMPDHRLAQHLNGQRTAPRGSKHEGFPAGEASANNGWSFFDNAHGGSCSMRPGQHVVAPATGGASWGAASAWLAASPQPERSPSSLPMHPTRPPPPPRVDGGHITDPAILRAAMALTPLPPPLMVPSAADIDVDNSDEEWA